MKSSLFNDLFTFMGPRSYYYLVGISHNHNMDAIRSRARKALFRNGIIIHRYENCKLVATEINTERLRTITEEEARHFRSVGEQTLPIVMQYIKQLKEIFNL